MATGGLLVLVPLLALRRSAPVRNLLAAATTDPKTGLLNARAWEQAARRTLDRRAPADAPAAVLILDLDHFKLVNDSFGHLTGDAVLREVGRALTAAVRAGDRVGRFGGEEFVVVLPGAGPAAARAVAERLRASVADVSRTGLVDELPLSVSIGCACAPRDGTELAELLRAADRALYAAKERGRNRVVFAGPAPLSG